MIDWWWYWGRKGDERVGCVEVLMSSILRGFDPGKGNGNGKGWNDGVVLQGWTSSLHDRQEYLQGTVNLQVEREDPSIRSITSGTGESILM